MQLINQQDLIKIPCPLCGGFNDKILSRRAWPGVPLNNVICRQCGLIRINPRPNDEWYKKFYQEDFFAYLRPFERPAYVEELEHSTDPNYLTPVRRQVLPFFWQEVPKGARVLDIGAGFGQILYHFKNDKQAIVVGLEPNPQCRAIAKEKFGLHLLNIMAEEFFSSNQEKFDFIVMDQLVEHLLYPSEFFAKLSTQLSDNGLIYISVPNAYNPQIPISLFYQVAHTFNYTPFTLWQMVKRYGFKIIKAGTPDEYPIRMLLAKQSSSWPSVAQDLLIAGNNWQQVAAGLKRKRRLNIIRGVAKYVLNKLGGQKFTQWLRQQLDRLMKYRY